MPAYETIVGRLNETFGTDAIRQLDTTVLRRFSLARAAAALGIVEEGSAQQRFVARWPRAHQEALRGVLLNAVRRRKPVSFHWRESRSNQLTVEELRDRITVHFQSPIIRLRG